MNLAAVFFPRAHHFLFLLPYNRVNRRWSQEKERSRWQGGREEDSPEIPTRQAGFIRARAIAAGPTTSYVCTYEYVHKHMIIVMNFAKVKNQITWLTTKYELGRSGLSTWKYQFSYDHWSPATLGSVSTWMGDCSSVAWVLLLTLKVG